MSKRILIVDDDPDIRRLVSLALTDESPYTVHAVSSGEAALLSIARQPIDLLFTDLRMPGMSGLELVRHVRELDPQTAVIVFTISPNDVTPQQIEELKIDCLLEKPLSPDQIRLAVDLLLDPSNLLPKTGRQPATMPAQPVVSARPGPRSTAPLAEPPAERKRVTTPLKPAPVAVRITPGGRLGAGHSYSDLQIEAMRNVLKELALEPDVYCAVLADMSGIVLTHWSKRRDINVTVVAALAAGNSLALAEISRTMGQQQPSHLVIQEGYDQSILMAHMGNLLLVLAIGPNASLGWARIATMRTCEEVLRITHAE
jgi:CheY-like chemotaxis protein